LVRVPVWACCAQLAIRDLLGQQDCFPGAVSMTATRRVCSEQHTVCLWTAAAVSCMPDSHMLVSRAWASILPLPAFSASSTSSIPRFLPCGKVLGVVRFSLSANTEGICDVPCLSGLRGRIASDDSTIGELMARGVKSPKARREGV
jgi:hypothetical protein